MCIHPIELAFGSVVTLKNHRAGGALLHSHTHLYPKEHPPEQQQVTSGLNVTAACISCPFENNTNTQKVEGHGS